MKKHLQIVFLMLLVVNISAQELSQMRVVGKGEFLPSELISKDNRDSNGEVCAAVVISTDLDGLSFQAYNGIVKTNSNPGRHFIFVSPTERVVEVFKSGYKPLKIILNDYGINLKSGQAWGIEVTGDKLTSDLIPITITTNPTDAKINIDNKEALSGKATQTAIGKHNVTISKAGFGTITKEIEVTTQQVVFSFNLQEIELQAVQINSNPDGAKVYIDNIDKGTTNKGLFLFPGSYSLKLSKSGYLDKEEKIEVLEGKANSFNYNITKNVGTLSVSVTPSDATIFINKENYSGKGTIELSPGKYKIEISKEGYYPEEETIEIVLGKSVTKNYTLKPKVGKLQFAVSPPEANAELQRNGKTIEKWQGLKIIKDLQVGEYEITVKNTGNKTTKKNIKIEENKTAQIDITLEKGSDAPENMIFVKGGAFQMGGDDGEMDEKPTHSVTLNDFYISKYEVTQKDWKDVMGNNPSYFKEIIYR